MTNFGWTAAVYYALGLTSAVLPWVNGELVMLSAVPLADTSLRLGILVGVVTAGQITGKATIFWIARRAKGPRGVRLEAKLGPWHTRLHRCPRAALGIMLLSSTVGVPPFYVVSIAAGALNVAFGRFLAIGTLGRFVHFAAIACAPQLLWRIP